MLWALSVTGQRYRAVLEVRAGAPVTEVAERYGVSRQGVHAWLRHYRDEGPSGLADRSHKVRFHPPGRSRPSWSRRSASCAARTRGGAEAAGVRDGPRIERLVNGTGLVSLAGTQVSVRI